MNERIGVALELVAGERRHRRDVEIARHQALDQRGRERRMARVVPIFLVLHPLALILQIPVGGRLGRRGGVADGVAVIDGDRRAKRILEQFALVVADDHQDIDTGCIDIALEPVHGLHGGPMPLGLRTRRDFCRGIRRQGLEQFIERARHAVEIVDRRPPVDAVEHLLPVLDRRHQHRRMRRAERRHHLRHWVVSLRVLRGWYW